MDPAALAGQTRRYLTEGLDRLGPARRDNVLRIFALAADRAGPDKAAADRALPAALIGRLLESASYCEDPVADAYWAGIVASSLTRFPRDDRGLRQARLLERLSLNQIRSHGLFYSLLRTLCLHHPGAGRFDLDSRRYLLATFVPAGSYAQAMDLQPDEIPGLGPLVTDILAGLSAANLLDGSNTGSEAYLKTYFKSAAIVGEGIVFAPSPAGLELYLWACGAGGSPLARFLRPDLPELSPAVPARVPGAALVYEQGQSDPNPALRN